MLLTEGRLGLRDPRLLRSVHLERDWLDGYDPHSFILGSAAVDVIEQILTAVRSKEQLGKGKAFTLTGPYGTGKSALALFASEMLCGTEPRRRSIGNQLAEFGLRAGISTDAEKPYVPVLVTCSGRPLAALLTESINRSCMVLDITVQETSDPLMYLEALSKAALLKGFGGVFVVLDELGKALEYAARNPEQSDVYLLQQLAEYANRAIAPICLLGILHQAFSEYVDELDQATKTEWAKVQGRFTDITYLPSEALLARLISDSIGFEDLPHEWRHTYDSVARSICQFEGVWPSALDEDAFVSLCMRAYPLHPMVLVVLPTLMRRLGQNERSVFAFLAERGLLSEHRGVGLVRLDTVFEHMADWVGFGLKRSSGARFWRLACEILDSRSGMQVDEIQLVKTIGILMSVSTSTKLEPTIPVLSLALMDAAEPSTELLAGIEGLSRRSVVTHRRHRDAYVLWQGSDVDLESEIEKGRRETHGKTGLASSLAGLSPLPNLIARKHSFDTGTLRWFAPIYVDEPEDLVLPELPAGGADGFFAICLGATKQLHKRFERAASSSKRNDLVFAISHRTPHLKALLDELAAMDWVDSNVAALRDDRVAREELAFQRVDLLAHVRREIAWLTNPGEGSVAGCEFWCGGKKLSVASRRELSRALSDQFDELFGECILVKNELINRRELSSAAAAARRTLLEAMLNCSHLPRLGMQGFPPERAIYESVFLQSGMHVEGGDGMWAFVPPSGQDPCRFSAVWGHIAVHLFERFPHPVSVKSLMDDLLRPPFGVIQGLFPLILCAFLLVHDDETTLYKEGTFIPSPSIVHWELMLRRPDLFEVAGCRLSGVRKQVLDELSGRLGFGDSALLPVVRFLVRSIETLPGRAKTSKKASESALNLRDVILAARSPEALLFHDVPISLGLPPLDDAELDKEGADEFVARLKKALEELNNIVSETYRWARAELARAAGLPPNDEGWIELRRIAGDIVSELREPRTREFCQRLCVSDNEQAEIGAISIVAMRPVETWTDTDLQLFPAQAETITKELRSEVVRTGINADPIRKKQADKVEDALRSEVGKLMGEGNDRLLLLGVLRRLLRQLEKENPE